MAYRDTRVVIGKDKQLKPLLCALDTCTEPVTGNQKNIVLKNAVKQQTTNIKTNLIKAYTKL